MVFPKHGRIFLGKDEKTYGKEGTGMVDYDPEFECGGPPGTPGRQCPHQLDQTESMGKDDSSRLIHLAMPSYRDKLCPKTLFNLFTKAKHPEKIRVRVLQQNIPDEDVECLETYCQMIIYDHPEELERLRSLDPAHSTCPFESQVFVHKIHAKDAAGPTWARGLLSEDIAVAADKLELSPQDFCMSTDSHMDFEPHWDESMVNMFNLAENEYAVLSTYVADIEQMGVNLNGNHEVPHLCMITFVDNVRVHATKMCRGLSKPKLTNAVWGAGLSFSKCHAELKVPVDPHTPGVFNGEEFNRAARFFTYGYDIYTPHRVYVLHNYHESQSDPKAHSWLRKNVKDSHKRLLTMIDVPGGETDPEVALRLKQSKYGLGDRRTIDQLIEFSGFDLRNRKVTIDGKNRCGNIKWVPFTEHPFGVNYLPRFDENEDPLDVPDSSSVWFTESNDMTIEEENTSTTDIHSNSIENTPSRYEPPKRHISDVVHKADVKTLKKVHELPIFVKFMAFVLVTAMSIVIYCSKGTGRKFYKRRKL